MSTFPLKKNFFTGLPEKEKPGQYGVLALKKEETTAKPAAKPKVKPGSYVKPGGKATGSMKDYPLYSQARRDEYTARGWKQDATTKVKSSTPKMTKGLNGPEVERKIKPKSKAEVEAYANNSANFKGDTQFDAMQAGTGNKVKGNTSVASGNTKTKGNTTIASGNTKNKTKGGNTINVGSGNDNSKTKVQGDKTKIKVGKGATIVVSDQSTNTGTSSSLPTKYGPKGVNSGQDAPPVGGGIPSSVARKSAAAADKTQVTNNTNVNKITASTAKGSGTPTTGDMNSISSRTTMPRGGGSGMGQISAVKNEIASLANKFGPASASSQSNIGAMTTKVENSYKSPVKKESKTSLDMEKDFLASLEKNNPDRFM